MSFKSLQMNRLLECHIWLAQGLFGKQFMSLRSCLVLQTFSCAAPMWSQCGENCFTQIGRLQAHLGKLCMRMREVKTQHSENKFRQSSNRHLCVGTVCVILQTFSGSSIPVYLLLSDFCVWHCDYLPCSGPSTSDNVLIAQ